MDCLSSVLSCLCGDGAYSRPSAMEPHGSANEKTTLMTGTRQADADRIAGEFVDVLSSAGELDAALKAQLRPGQFHCNSWTEDIAKAVFDRLGGLIQAFAAGEVDVGDGLKEAIAAVRAVAERTFDLALDHPVEAAILASILAIGVLWIVSPWVLPILGFGEGGVVEGSVAAVWQSLYRGFVPKRSLFAYLQHLGATFGRL